MTDIAHIVRRLRDEAFFSATGRREEFVEAADLIDRLCNDLDEADKTIDAFGKVTPQQYEKEIAALKAELARSSELSAEWKARHDLVLQKHIECCGAGWRPIDTAPRDGSRILLCWNDSATLSPHVELGKRKGFTWANTYGHPFSGEPTHWMALPEPEPYRAPVSSPVTEKTDG